MLAIKDLLNPEREPQRPPRPTPTYHTRHELSKFHPSSSVRAQVPVNFPPYEHHNKSLISRLDIQAKPLTLPYSSQKKDFLTKTGRKSLHVYSYEFDVPDGIPCDQTGQRGVRHHGQETTYTAMWDFEIGLVRITPFFKSLNYNKTQPALVLNRNPGLREICPSITGGTVQAQGYWMPYDCAKALCATFCYPIRDALVPLFGPQFPNECVPPKTRAFQDMVISPDVIRRAASSKVYTCGSGQVARRRAAHKSEEHMADSQPPKRSRRLTM